MSWKFGRPLSLGPLLLLLQCWNLEIEFSPIDYPSSTAFQRFLTYSLLACLAHMDRFFFRHSSFSAFLFLLSYLPLFAGPTSAEQQRHSQLLGHFLFIFIFSPSTTFFLAARSIEQSLNRTGNVATFRSGAFPFNTLIQVGPLIPIKMNIKRRTKLQI
jgi:hypothetical protein